MIIKIVIKKIKEDSGAIWVAIYFLFNFLVGIDRLTESCYSW